MPSDANPCVVFTEANKEILDRSIKAVRKGSGLDFASA